jgi:hypothetical protein
MTDMTMSDSPSSEEDVVVVRIEFVIYQDGYKARSIQYPEQYRHLYDLLLINLHMTNFATKLIAHCTHL